MSTWRSAGELYDVTRDADERDRLFNLYGLALFAENAFLAGDYSPSPEWGECIVLTRHAHECMKVAQESGVSGDKAYWAQGLFELFYYHDLFIDYTAVDPTSVSRLLEKIQKTGQARWPYVFGNCLYHKFNDLPNATTTDELGPGDADSLLSGTPAGVFQVGNLVSGPLGFVEGLEHRLLIPTLDVLLWHCSDPGCGKGHVVAFRRHKSPYRRFLSSLVRSLRNTFGPRSEWHRPILWIPRFGKWANGRPFSDLPAVIGDCIVGSERTALLARSLRSPHNSLLLQAITRASRKPGVPEEVAAGLTPEEQHQLLLLLPDGELVRFIDELVREKAIRVPPAELRACKTYAYGPPRDITSRLSSLGLRSSAHPAVVELACAIWSTYETLGQTDDLVWRLRGHESTTLRHSVMDFIRTHGPEQTARELIFPSRSVATTIAEKCSLQIAPGEDERACIGRLLWKLGFNLPRYDDTYELLRNRIQEFQNCILKLGSEFSEGDKAEVRKVGVNLFVSVETFLEDLLCYNVWMLTSDHFTGTHFLFKREDAHQAIIRTLGASIESGDNEFSWSIIGANALGTLLAYLNGYRTWLKGRADADRGASARAEQDFPHYATDTVQVFPFKHTELWADMPTQALAAYSETIDQMCTQLAQADIANVRNGIDHKREEEGFPSADRMLACASRLQQVVETADTRRLVPKLFWGRKSESDSYGNTCDTFTDYRGGLVSLWGPSIMFGNRASSFDVPYLIAPADLLHLPNAMLFFTITAKSEYRDYWKNYPRRRFIPTRKEGMIPPGGDRSQA